MREARLDAILSKAGFTRSRAREIVRAGRVRVDGEVARDFSLRADAANVTLDGAPVAAQRWTHIVMNKPAGRVTAARDGISPTVFDLIENPPRELCAVGRLDKDVTGVLLFTTDGQLAHRLISPRWEIEKRYRARVEGMAGEDAVALFASGVPLKDFTCKPARLTVLSAAPDESLCEVVVTEGKFHQVKRMFERAGHPVKELERVSVAGLTAEGLEAGEWRPLTGREAEALYAAVNLEEDRDE